MLASLAARAAAMAGELPLSAQQQAALQEARASAGAAYTAHVQAHAATQAARQAKDRAQREAARVARAIARQLQADPAVSDAQRQGLGLPVHDRTRTRVAAPRTAPLAVVDASQRLQHHLVIRDAAHGGRRGKPAGALGCEVWMALAPPGAMAGEADAAPDGVDPAAAAGRAFLGISTNGRFTQTFERRHAGWTASYRLRWFSRRGQKEPWGEGVDATVAG